MSDSSPVGHLVLTYLSAFNTRDESTMRSCFSPSLVTIHPDDPSLDVTTSAPFIERMISLWRKDFYYQLRELSEVTMSNHNCLSSVVFAEFSIGKKNSSPAATELVRYRCSDLINEITVYKIFNPTHSIYSVPLKKYPSSCFGKILNASEQI